MIVYINIKRSNYLEIKCKIHNIIYRKETNGYSVLLVKNEDSYITAVGETASIDAGDSVLLEGDYVTHKSYGKQFSFSKITKVLPSDLDAIIKYISCGLVKGLGEKTAEKIVAKFGEKTIDVIRYEKEKLIKIKGMSLEKAYELSEKINTEWERWNLSSFLLKYDLGVNTSNKIYDKLGIDAINIIRESPYALIEFVSSLDFKVIDKLAEKLEIDKTNSDRIKYGIIYLLMYLLRQGNTCYLLDEFVKEVSKFLEVDETHIYNRLKNLTCEDKIKITKKDDQEYIYIGGIYYAEKNIADKVLESLKKSSKNIRNIEKLIEDVSIEESLVLSKEQKEAIELSINSNISIITGGPGTGKTTIIKFIIDILRKSKLEYTLAAPTGRAARRITDMTRENASTIHRLLEITKVDDNDIDQLVFFPITELKVDYLIVDEASMIDTILMNNIMKALDSKTKLILVGDVDQIPSVGAGNVLKDLIQSGTVPAVYLSQIYRQSAKSDIVLNAHNVKSGEKINFKNNNTDMFFVEANSIEDTKNKVEELITTRLDKYIDKKLEKDICVLTPIKKTDIGTIELNKMLQKLKIKYDKNTLCKKIGDKTFYINDKVMQIVNNYDLKWDQNSVEGLRNI